MSADRQLSPRSRSPLLPGAEEAFPAELETLRRFVNERLTAAVDDILGLFGETVARYRQQIDRQQRQLDSLKPEEGSWSRAAELQVVKLCPEDPGLTAGVEQPGAAQIKTEAGGEETHGDSDPAGGSAASDARLLAESSETDDSGDYWRGGLWRPEEPEEPECQSSSLVAPESRQPPAAFSCKVCGESFRRMSYLLTHAAAHLRDCGLCGERLEPGGSLKLHLRAHRQTAFRCSVCGQSFTLRGNLRTHMRIHSGERPHGCTVCGKSFGRRATLVRHVRSHTGEKPFTCSYCGHGFVEKGNLTVHLRTHTGERPFWCSICDRRFSQQSSFYKHPCQRRGLGTPLTGHT